MGSRTRGVAPFDPNSFTAYNPEEINSNDALRDVYEPGSTMKAIVTAIGLQTGAFTTTTTVNDTGTIIREGDIKISNWNYRQNGILTPADMLYYSSNVAALQFGEMIGPDHFYDYLKLFGYGQQTGIDLGGEEQGIVKWPNGGSWQPLDLSVNSYGHSIGVTPIQHLNAYGVLANGGVLMRPYVVKEICDGDQCTATKPYEVRRVLDQAVTEQLRPMLARNSEHYGAAMWWQFSGSGADQPLVPGYHTAAKTGTSQIPDENGEYHANIVVASVAGWAPLENPRVTILVRVDEPEGGVNGTGIYGTDAAIPSFQRLVTQIMRYYRIAPDLSYIGPGQELGGPPLPVITPSPSPSPASVPAPQQGVLPVPSDPAMLPTPTARVLTP
jgi:cell division protein FtsI (penicillin-binding protein 3)